MDPNVGAIAECSTNAFEVHQAGSMQGRHVGPHLIAGQHHANLALARRVERQVQHRLRVSGSFLRTRRRWHANQRQGDEA